MGDIYYCSFPGPQGLTREWPQRERLPAAGSDVVVGQRITALVRVQEMGVGELRFLRTTSWAQ